MIQVFLRRAVCLAIFLTVLAARGASAQAGQAGADAAPQAMPVDGYPVELDGEELYRVVSGIGAFTAQDRAERAAEHIQRVADDPFYSPTLVEVRMQGADGAVYYRGELLGIGTAAASTSDPSAACWHPRVRR